MNAPHIPPRTLAAMTRIFADYPELTEVILFGSRATGGANERSDIDLATRGIADSRRLGCLALDLDDIPAPQQWDVCSYENIKSSLLKKHIDEFGISVYHKR